MKQFEGKVVLITGGARDIGREVTLHFARQGAKVCINYFGNSSSAEETLQLVKNIGAEGIIVQGDMTKYTDVEHVVATCLQHFGSSIHHVVNVAGGLVGRKLLHEMDEEFWDFVMNVNVKTAFLVCKATVPHMPAGSTIVNFSSQAARDGGGFGASAYSSAKGAVLTFTRSMAKELSAKGIRVNCVSPGMINTTFHNTFTKPEVRANVANATPLKREGEAKEVADLVLYLSSNQSSFITGQSVEINGGTYFI